MAGTRRYDRHGQLYGCGPRIPSERTALILGVCLGVIVGVIVGAWLA